MWTVMMARIDRRHREPVVLIIIRTLPNKAVTVEHFWESRP